MKLNLPDVTLVAIETREHKLMRMAIDDCLRVADFGEVLILTDVREKITHGEFGVTDLVERCQPRIHIVPDWPEKTGWARSMWFDVPPLLRTSHALLIQWDSWIWDASMWSDDFLKYDYIGSPWWYKDGKNVGNSGFALKSTRLARYVCERRLSYPCDTSAEDDLLCRGYRSKLEDAGFVWAPEKVAHKFAFECCRPSEDSRHFGFHGMFNWPDVLDRDRLHERMEVAMKSPYIMKPGGYMLKAFCEKHPEVAREIAINPKRKGLKHGEH